MAQENFSLTHSRIRRIHGTESYLPFPSKKDSSFFQVIIVIKTVLLLSHNSPENV